MTPYSEIMVTKFPEIEFCVNSLNWDIEENPIAGELFLKSLAQLNLSDPEKISFLKLKMMWKGKSETFTHKAYITYSHKPNEWDWEVDTSITQLLQNDFKKLVLNLHKDIEKTYHSFHNSRSFEASISMPVNLKSGHTKLIFKKNIQDALSSI
jgi:hypothetical protein